MTTTISVEVSYAQLAVFVSSLKQPFNDWTDRHISQGFAWRPGSVSFRTIVEAGPHCIEIEVTDHVGIVRGDTKRIVDVPFEVPADGQVEVGSISETTSVSLPPGTFLLRCEFLRSVSSTGERVRLTFAKRDTPRFEIVRADSELITEGELLTDAQPASG